MVYNYPQSRADYIDVPAYTQMTEDWVGRSTTSAPVTKFLVVDNGATRTTTITRPDGPQIKQIVNSDKSSALYGVLQQLALYKDGVALRMTKSLGEIGEYNSPRPTRTESYDERGRMTATTLSYDQAYGSLYNSVTDARAYGYGGELFRRAHTEYLNNANYNGFLQNSGTLWWKQFGPPSGGPNWSGSHIFNLVSVAEVYAGDDVTRPARAEYQYDGPALTNNPGMVQHNHWYNPHTPPQEVCGTYPDPDDPDCNGQCGPCQNPPCPEPPPNCDGNCNQIPFCNYIPQYDPRTWYRGNVTQIKRYADAASLDQSTAVVETRTYDIAGNVRVQSSSCCEQTTITCTTNTQYAWPESQTSGSPSETNKQNTSSATYDFNTGLVKTSTDANGRETPPTEYDPSTLRPVREYSPTGSYNYHIYDDVAMTVADFAYEAGLDGANFASRVDQSLDGRGSVIKEISFGKDNAQDIVSVKYNQLGRVSQQSRPYRAGATPLWTTVTYDFLDRLAQTIAPDAPNNSIVTRSYNQADPPGSSGQPGETVKVTDPWGRERWARSDALGRMVEAAEPDPGGDGTLSSGALFTTYTYDALDRLVQVNQGAQTRSFRYDSLGRLTHQKLAERDAKLNDSGAWIEAGQWSDVFTYDNRSNLTQHVDARGVKTIFKYKDAGGVEEPLNRLLAVEYDKSGSPSQLSVNIPVAPNVSYAYMTTKPGDKRRVQNVIVDQGMGNETMSYDSEGQLSRVVQTFTGRESYPIVTDYIWDSLGRLKESDYPKQYGAGEIRKKVEPTYDVASRLESLKFGGATYASEPVYNAASQTTSLKVGAQMIENYEYDPKTGLLTNQKVKHGTTDTLLDLKYNYTLNNDANNNGPKTGQLTGITDLKNQARNRAYEYDQLGRLIKVKGGVNAFTTPNWYQTYSYDRYGNRSLVQLTAMGMTPVKPGSQSRSDLIGKIGPGAGGAANRIFSADEPFAALGINGGYGSITAGFLDNDSAGTPMRGGPRVTAEEYDNSPSANSIGRESLAEHPAGAAPRAPRKKYGYRGGPSRSPVAAQSVGNVYPSAYQKPDDYWGGDAVYHPSNTGHGDTVVTASGENFDMASCMWQGFQFGGQALSIVLKVDWSERGNLSGLSYNEFLLEYSLDGGSNWNIAFDHTQLFNGQF